MLKPKIRALASYINPVNWPIYYEYYESRAYRRTLEINLNRLTLFGAVSDDREKIIFGLSNGKESFAAEYFAHECQRVARMEFAAQCWGRISAGLLKLAEAFNAASSTGESGGTDA